MSGEKRTTIRIPEDLRKFIEVESERRGLSCNEFILYSVREEKSRYDKEILTTEKVREIAREESLKIISEHGGTNISNRGIGNKQNVQIRG